MRLAFISDIHGNFVALEAVLADIDQEANVDQIICLGDVANLGPQPHEVVACLRERQIPCVMGNHDAFLLDDSLVANYTKEPWFGDTIKWCLSRLTAEDLQFIRSFEPLIRVSLGGGDTLLAFHGSPESNTDNIFATTPNDELNAMLNGHRSAVMIGGHTHVQMVRQYKGHLLVNAGSVGMPFEEMPFTKAPRMMPWAEYTIVTWRKGIISLDLRRIPLDLQLVKLAGIESRMPDLGDWFTNWVTDWKSC